MISDEQFTQILNDAAEHTYAVWCKQILGVAPPQPNYAGNPAQTNSVVAVLDFFAQLPKHAETLFSALEEKFIAFEKKYCHALPKARFARDFDVMQWASLQDNKRKASQVNNQRQALLELPYYAPVPSDAYFAKLKSYSLLPKSYSRLTLFIYSQLLHYKIIGNDLLDKKIFYCLGHVSEETMVTHLAQGKLFVETGPSGYHFHGKHTHLLQLILLAIAYEQGILKLELSFAELLKVLLNTEENFRVEDTDYSVWDFCLDSARKGNLTSAYGTSLCLLSSFSKKYSPSFYNHYMASYIKAILKYGKCYEGPWREDWQAAPANTYIARVYDSLEYKSALTEVTNGDIAEYSIKYKSDHVAAIRSKIVFKQLTSRSPAVQAIIKRLCCETRPALNRFFHLITGHVFF